MNGVERRLEERAADLRRAFDQSFAEAPILRDVQVEDFLAIRLYPDPYAVRLSEVAGVFAGRRVVAVPSAVREFLGVVGLRGAICPVYDLRALLGYSPSSEVRWLMVAAKLPVAFAFDELDGHLRLERAAIAEAENGRRAHVHEIVAATEARPVIRLASVLESVEERCRVSHTGTERTR